ncbi:MAG: ABC transporter permease [Conexibacteraceae bacterium]|nr:ABC transporter permease [Conexibacteraceae bacterium]
MRRWLLPLLAILVVLGIWELYVLASGVSSLVLPSPIDVVRALFNDRGALWHNFKPTAAEICLGLVLGAAVALCVAVALRFSGLVRDALYPSLVASQAIPIPILAPLLVVWLGFGLLPKLIMIALVSFFPIVVTTLSALAAVDPDLIKLMRTFDAGRLQTFWRVELPSALPGLFAGAKLAAVFSVLAAILAEQAGASSGLGELLTITIGNLETAEAFATVFVLAAFAILLFALLTLFERRALPWIHTQRDTQTR